MSELHERIDQQYASPRGRAFYKTVMGDGGFDIHYGIYRDSAATMREATAAATDRLYQLAAEVLPRAEGLEVLDLGAGRGGPAHRLATTRAAKVTCVDLCDEHQRENRDQAVVLGIEHQISQWTGAYESLPEAWTGKFDLVWAQESLCHAADLSAVIDEAYRVTRPGGVFALTDIMLSESATPDQAAVFSGVNAVTRLSTPATYRSELIRAGFVVAGAEDWSEHLESNFRRMLLQIEKRSKDLSKSGVDQDYVDRFSQSLRERIRWSEGAVLRWCVFIAIHP